MVGLVGQVGHVCGGYRVRHLNKVGGTSSTSVKRDADFKDGWPDHTPTDRNSNTPSKEHFFVELDPGANLPGGEGE